MMIVEINMDDVVINGTVVPRPTHMGRAEWERWWQKAQEEYYFDDCPHPGCPYRED